MMPVVIRTSADILPCQLLGKSTPCPAPAAWSHQGSVSLPAWAKVNSEPKWLENDKDLWKSKNLHMDIWSCYIIAQLKKYMVVRTRTKNIYLECLHDSVHWPLLTFLEGSASCLHLGYPKSTCSPFVGVRVWTVDNRDIPLSLLLHTYAMFKGSKILVTNQNKLNRLIGYDRLMPEVIAGHMPVAWMIKWRDQPPVTGQPAITPALVSVPITHSVRDIQQLLVATVFSFFLSYCAEDTLIQSQHNTSMARR